MPTTNEDYLEVINGLVFCAYCGEYVKPKYYDGHSKVCICSVCHRPLKRGKAKRRYEDGMNWCSRCQDFRARMPNTAFHCCIECHTKLRSRSYTKHAKQERELTLKRY